MLSRGQRELVQTLAAFPAFGAASDQHRAAGGSRGADVGASGASRSGS